MTTPISRGCLGTGPAPRANEPVGVFDPDEQVWIDHLRDEAAFDGREWPPPAWLAEAPRTRAALKAYIAHRDAGGAASDAVFFEQLYQAAITAGASFEPGATT